MRVFLFGSIAFDEIGRFRGRFKDVIRPELMDKLSVSFLVDETLRHFGGCSGNEAYGMGLLKVPAYLCSRIGTDGSDYKKAFLSWGMNTDYLDTGDGFTARAFMITDEDGAQIASFTSGVIGTKSPAFQLPGIAGKDDIILVGPENHNRMVQALHQGVEKGLRVFFDPGQLIHTFNCEELEWIFKSVEAVLVNEYEWELLQSLSGKKGEEIIAQIPLIWITKGSEGVALYQKGSETLIPALKIESSDPTGAGDAFRAGLLAGFAKGFDAEKSSKVGVVLGAAAAGHALAQGYSFTADQVAALKTLGFEL